MAPPKEGPAIAARLEFPALLEEASIAPERGGKVKVLLATGLHDGPTQRVGIKQHHDLDARRGLALPNELRGQLGGFVKGEPQGRTRRLFDLVTATK